MRLVSISTDRQRPHVPVRAVRRSHARQSRESGLETKASCPRNRAIQGCKREGPVAQTTGERTDIEGETGGRMRPRFTRALGRGNIDHANRSTAVRRDLFVPEESLRELQERNKLDVLPGTVYEEQERFGLRQVECHCDMGSRWSN